VARISRFSAGTAASRLQIGLPGAGSCAGAGRDPAACRVGSEGLKQRGRPPRRRGVRGGSPALQLRELLIRSKVRLVQVSP
jgi:hypothetical protein